VVYTAGTLLISINTSMGLERQPRMIKLKSPKAGQWKKNERSKPETHPNATIDILMAKYKEDRVDIREHENWTT
jgi:hypothetical protein